MVNRILREPYGDVTAVAQCIVVLSSIRDFVERFLYLVASALVEFVGHEVLGRTVWPESCPNLRQSPPKLIYSTTPWRPTTDFPPGACYEKSSGWKSLDEEIAFRNVVLNGS